MGRTAITLKHRILVAPALLAVLTACTPKTNVSATGNVPAQYNHVYLTAQQIWFNGSATAGPDDSGWQKFTLNTPVTVDLFNASEGTVTQLSTALGVSAGSYAQIRLIPIDASAALTSAANAAGAAYNSEVDYTDSAGVTHQLPLELQNPDKGIGIATNLTIAAGVSTQATSLVATGTGTANTGTQTDTGFFTGTLSTGAIQAGTATTGSTIIGSTGNGTATAATSVSTPIATSTPVATALTVAISIDTARDLAFFNYSGTTGILLNPHAVAYNTSGLGAIQGSISLSNLPGVTSVNGHLPIQVTAELLSSDGTRHLPINSTAVTSSGSFVLYPLPTGSSRTVYDLVIHGAGIRTIIIRGVPVNPGAPSTTTPVSIGTLAPAAAGTFAVNLNDAYPIPAGALVGFYQTLPFTGEVPYLIEERPIDPFSRTFAANQALSTGIIDFGTFVSGAVVVLNAVTPDEGSSGYRAAAAAPLFATGELSGVIAPAPVNPVLVTPPALSVASGASADTLSIALSQSTAGKYNAGQLIISRDGAVVATASLDGLLAQAAGGTLALDGLPGGSGSSTFPQGLYYVSVRTWNSADPIKTLNRETYPMPADLRSGSVAGYSINID